MQPRIRLTRSFDQRHHTYLGYVLHLEGTIAGEEREFSEPLAERSHVVRLARRDLARVIATSPESVSRRLHRFAAEHSIQCSRTEIRLLDIAALRRAAGGGPFSGLDGDQLGY